MLKKRKQGLIASARRFMEEGETVRELCLTQTFVTPGGDRAGRPR